MQKRLNDMKLVSTPAKQMRLLDDTNSPALKGKLILSSVFLYVQLIKIIITNSFPLKGFLYCTYIG